ncbi:hypothetical protein PLESTB_000333500 [Pleodorina starrii]|uniref:Uncharacterized protein n=1 Tax=Pleodorina starrii TaxID=330485 RepID=A0A9W6BE11_9CHLO|nr:hypothetical protein PLESTM_001882600 [Pleodorina starrii]GLC50018.1 hypothetical protein PLESTB_000333500 [Pleodorina starrii]
MVQRLQALSKDLTAAVDVRRDAAHVMEQQAKFQAHQRVESRHGLLSAVVSFTAQMKVALGPDYPETVDEHAKAIEQRLQALPPKVPDPGPVPNVPDAQHLALQNVKELCGKLVDTLYSTAVDVDLSLDLTQSPSPEQQRLVAGTAAVVEAAMPSLAAGRAVAPAAGLAAAPPPGVAAAPPPGVAAAAGATLALSAADATQTPAAAAGVATPCSAVGTVTAATPSIASAAAAAGLAAAAAAAAGLGLHSTPSLTAVERLGLNITPGSNTLAGLNLGITPGSVKPPSQGGYDLKTPQLPLLADYTRLLDDKQIQGTFVPETEPGAWE